MINKKTGNSIKLLVKLPIERPAIMEYSITFLSKNILVNILPKFVCLAAYRCSNELVSTKRNIQSNDKLSPKTAKQAAFPLHEKHSTINPPKLPEKLGNKHIIIEIML